jgi:EmrB/QacA subfamily drug resistance transporter
MAPPTILSTATVPVQDRSTKSRWALVVTCVAAFMVTLDALVVITALPAIQQSFGASLDSLQWTINAYTLAFAAGIVTASTLGDRYGRRRIFASGVALFALSSAACALAPSADSLIVARTVQGLAGAMVAPTALTILTSAFSVERRGAIVGVYGGVTGLAVASGPLVGGVLTQALGWHSVFWLNVPIGLVAAALALSRLDESYGPASPLDLPAVGLVSGGAVGIVLGLVRASDQGWASPETVLSLGLGILLMAGFVVWELRAADPMVPMRMFRNVTFSAANATAFFMTGSQFAAAFLIAQYFQLGQGYSPMETGLRVLPWTATPLVVAPLAGAASDRLGRRPLLLLGMFLEALGFVLFVFVATTDAAYWQVILPLVVSGVGVSMVLPVAPAAVLSAVAPIDVGRASAVSNTLQRFGTAFGVAVATAVFIANGSLANPDSFSAGFRPALLAVAGLAVLGALSALAVRKPEAILAHAAVDPATSAVLAA